LISADDGNPAPIWNLDIEAIWRTADNRERRVLVEELVESVAVFTDQRFGDIIA
jgi:hypothetical protein